MSQGAPLPKMPGGEDMEAFRPRSRNQIPFFSANIVHDEASKVVRYSFRES